MQIKFASITVDSQEKALRFYTDVLGFSKKSDIPMGEYRWLTVTSPDGVEGVELLLEPAGFPAAATYQKALYEAGMPTTALVSKDILAEYQQLKARGVQFRGPPQSFGAIMSVLFDDTCGNLVNLVQPTA